MKFARANLIKRKEQYDAAKSPEAKCKIARAFMEKDANTTIEEMGKAIDKIEQAEKEE
ncbi:hypothetical protein [Paenibacillus sambharensis]|uniref:hypothetical protein n=1 Tax=Paenibacillus sambharensis TaxID=1803190 RepID=UPI0015E8DF82|nr:hypothetical protein [Paenibacillus sambharensis]